MPWVEILFLSEWSNCKESIASGKITFSGVCAYANPQYALLVDRVWAVINEAVTKIIAMVASCVYFFEIGSSSNILKTRAPNGTANNKMPIILCSDLSSNIESPTSPLPEMKLIICKSLWTSKNFESLWTSNIEFPTSPLPKMKLIICKSLWTLNDCKESWTSGK